MKRIKRATNLALTLVITLNVSYAQRLKPHQDPAYGADSVARMECAGNLSTMSEFVKIKVFEYAYPAWGECFKKCPGASKNIYIHGEKIIGYKIENSESETEKQAFIDTLMMLYDQRIQYFNDEGKILGKKGISLLQYRRDAIEEAYGYLKKSLEIEKSDVDEAVAATFITCSSVLFKNNKLQADEMIANYLSAIEALNTAKQTEKTLTAIESVEKTFAESGAADCNALIEIFTPKYMANQQDVETLKKITELLKNSGCQKTDLFAQASESLFAIEPSATAGANLGIVFAAREEYSKAIEYYLKAVELETDAEKKAQNYFQLAAISVQTKNLPDVKKYGYEAVSLKPDFGEAYIIIGNAYALASSNCGSTNFEKASVYLAAVDKFIKAKSVDPTVSEKASELINNYSRFFPNNEDAFFEGYTDGQQYTVKCWINEPTTIRTIKK
ncbi:MAG: tetratricopeptide repeat protein [Bacteroidales bacterium]|nr:tetratricopeptide repeat protein [Bacteroidales bacterium]